MTPRRTAQVLAILDIWGVVVIMWAVYLAAVVCLPDVWLR
jgi:hypothetical protein